MNAPPGVALGVGEVRASADLLTWAFAQKALLDQAHAAHPELDYGYTLGTPDANTPLLTNCSSFLAIVLAGYLGTTEDALVPAGPGTRTMRLDDRVNIRNEAGNTRNIYQPPKDAAGLGHQLALGDRYLQGAVSALVDLGRGQAITRAEDIRRNTVLQAWKFRVSASATTVVRGHTVIATGPARRTDHWILDSLGANQPEDTVPGVLRIIGGKSVKVFLGSSVSATPLASYTTGVDEIYFGVVPPGLKAGNYTVVFGANVS